jgi:hypothetical protein
MDYYLKPPDPKIIYNRLKQSAKKRGIEFDLTVLDIYYIDIPITCPILGIPLKWHRGSPQDSSVSFDRIDSSKGYTVDNLQIISFRANRSKSNLTEDELKKFSMFFG